MNVNIGIQNTTAICGLLGRLLADEHVLSIKTHGAHWNVVGPDFAAAHAFFDSQYGDILGFIDEVAERVRQLGGVTVASMAEYVRVSQLSETVSGRRTVDYCKSLLSDHEAVIRYMRTCISKICDDYKDEGTANFLTDLMEKHEKMAWFLRSHIE